MTDYPEIETLSAGAVDWTPLDYEFSSERWAEGTEDGTGWRVCYGSVIPQDFDDEHEVEIEDPKTEDNRRLTFYKSGSVFKPAGSIGVEVRDEDGDYEETSTVTPGESEYEDLCGEFGLDGDEVRAEFEGEDHERWSPMMNYAYPLESSPPDDWKNLVNNCTCVEIDGNYYLALTGGGMDFTWEICESYMALGYLPPSHFARRLPGMAGRGQSERDRWIAAGCRRSLEVHGNWLTGGIETIDRALAD